MYKCDYCDKEFQKGRSKSSHQKWCYKGPNRNKSLEKLPKFDRIILKNFTDTCRYCSKKWRKITSNFTHEALCSNNPNKKVRNYKGNSHPHSEETKKKLSNIRIKYLINNPDKVIQHYGPSEPELYLGSLIKSFGIKCISQYMDKRWTRPFRIDHYLPDLNIGIEVNGEFKYKDNDLLPYYKEREDLILETSGIKILNIYYTEVYSLTKEKLMSACNSVGKSTRLLSEMSQVRSLPSTP